MTDTTRIGVVLHPWGPPERALDRVSAFDKTFELHYNTAMGIGPAGVHVNRTAMYTPRVGIFKWPEMASQRFEAARRSFHLK